MLSFKLINLLSVCIHRCIGNSGMGTWSRLRCWTKESTQLIFINILNIKRFLHTLRVNFTKRSFLLWIMKFIIDTLAVSILHLALRMKRALITVLLKKFASISYSTQRKFSVTTRAKSKWS